MGQKSTIRIEPRNRIGTGAARALRNTEKVPAVVYGAGVDPQTVSICSCDIEKELRTKGVLTRIFDLDAGENKSQKALIKSVQFHPVTDKPIHIDFIRITAGHKINIKVPLRFINDNKSPALKQGGVLNVINHMLEVSCEVDAVVDHIDVDLSGLNFHDTIKIKDISFPVGATVFRYNSDHTVATIVVPSSVRSEVAGKEEETAAPTAAAQPESTAVTTEQQPAKS
ncbi:MAG: 50S ribosomal protein L25/general stress protein Ctc [Holosporales bacterium]|jgi:large subunit ribosomal protein L25|nr:50S ribosomal protein L25/general stress protein Ctc [Holosporales bacterium]